jgi:hypothetical protein
MNSRPGRSSVDIAYGDVVRITGVAGNGLIVDPSPEAPGVTRAQ